MAINTELLKQLCAVHAPSGEESNLKNFILNHIDKEKSGWKVQPKIISDGIQDCLILVFGEPKTAVYAHMDSIGYTVAYKNQLETIGGPENSGNWQLVGEDSKGKIEATLLSDKDGLKAQAPRILERGTSLTFKPDFTETEHFIQSPYIDNRLGVLNALQLCEDAENAAIVFSCWEEHKGGSVPYLAKILYEEYGVAQALISDITWVTEGIEHGKGVAISMRDSGIPRRSYIRRIVGLAKESGLDHQLEVEGAGGSDGNAIQHSPYPVDWCFIGAPESHVHSPLEKVHKHDVESMFALYKFLLKHL